PMRARTKLLRDATVTAAKKAPSEDERNAQHAAFDALPESAKAKARDRLRILQAVEALVQPESGTTKFQAVEFFAAREGVSPRRIWGWFSMVDMIPASDWLFYLAPRHRNAARPCRKSASEKRFMDLLKADYLRLSGPTFTSSYQRAKRACQAEGIDVLPERTARRHLHAQVPRVTQVFAREGEHGLAKCFPAQTRDRTSMAAMEGVNADCHKFDVFVKWPGEKKPGRAQIVAFQDLYSSKILSWRVDTAPNKVAVMSAFGDMIEEYGIPQHCLFDNGREFANKWLTGGAPTRFRFKVREDDPLGVLTQLGIKIHWATPGHGQAKPIERAFRDFADHIAKDPRFDGAWTGNRPDAKPEDYGSRAIPIDEFIAVVAEGVADHNARLGRRSEVALGGSFDEAFAKSYETAAIRKATDEQRRLWLMAAETRQLHKGDGGVTLYGNRYWSAWMNEFAGQKVTLRFDAEDLHAGLYVYGLDGAFLGMAAAIEKVGFFDVTGAREHSRKVAQIKKAERQALDLHRELRAKDVATALDAIETPEPVKPEAKVVQIARGDQRPAASRVRRPQYRDEQSAEEKAEVLAFQKKVAAEQAAEAAKPAEDTPEDRYMRALDLERRSEAGERLGEAEVRWLGRYQQTPEYRGQRRMMESFGSDAFSKE
ncbi:MAG: Mu transposase C-terminal domain-containing protein, partial [Rhodobacteraceae bacterium]|nr:Mu transposase C-terminal domain-containing protein [Paracoccaceae bacterium]